MTNMLSIIFIDAIIARIAIFLIRLMLIKGFEGFKLFNKVVDSAKKIFL